MGKRCVVVALYGGLFSAGLYAEHGYDFGRPGYSSPAYGNGNLQNACAALRAGGPQALINNALASGSGPGARGAAAQSGADPVAAAAAAQGIEPIPVVPEQLK